MNHLTTLLHRLAANEEAPTMVEYGLLPALIALIVAVAAAFLGTQVSAFFKAWATHSEGEHVGNIR